MDIIFNQAKTNCIFLPVHPNLLPGLPLHFMNTDIVFVQVMSDFKSLSRDVKSQLFSTFSLDAYGSQRWTF